MGGWRRRRLTVSKGEATLKRYWHVLLVALTAASMMLLSFGVLLVLDRTADGADERRIAERVRAAELLAGSLDGWSDGERAGVEGRAQKVQSALARSEATSGSNRLIAFDPGAFEALYVVNVSGEVIAATARRAGLVGLERSARIILTARDGAVAGPVLLVDGLTQRVEVATAAPLPGGDVLVGVTDIETSRPWRALQAASATRGEAAVTLVDPEGHLLRVDQDPSKSVLLDGDSAPAASRAPDGPGSHTYPGEGEVATVGAFAPFGTGWAVVLTQSERSLLAGTRDNIWPVGLVLGLASLALSGLVLALERSRARLETSIDGTKRAILAVAGHELRTPMTVLKGMMGLLARRGADLPPDRHREIIEVLSAQTDKLEYLLERIIAVGHVAGGQRLAGAMREVDLVATTEHAVSYQRVLSPNHQLRLWAPEGQINVTADARVLRDTVVHLIDNAVRYSPGGGDVDVTVEVVDGEARLHVEDRGIGLPQSRDRLFEPFTQGQDVNTRVEDEGGLGMGLALVAAAVGEMSGAVGITDREDGGGVRATIRLPLRGGVEA